MPISWKTHVLGQLIASLKSQHDLGSALAPFFVENRSYFFKKHNLEKLFPKPTLNWETIWNYFLHKPNLQKLFLKWSQFTETTF